MFGTRVKVALALCLGAVLASACGSSAGSAGNNGSNGEPAILGDLQPFTGPLADYGVYAQVGCVAAAYVVNHDGGANGRQLKCVQIDDKDDPVDSVPALKQFYANNSGIVSILGPNSDTSLAEIPIIEQSQTPFISYTGLSYYAKTTNPYFWNLSLSDPEYGAAIAYAAYLSGYKRVAVVIGTNSGSQDLRTGLTGALRELGIPALIVENLPENQPSYSTEVARLTGLNPDCLIGEADPSTMATFMTDLKSQYHLLPIITSFTDLEPGLFQALDHTIGVPDLEKYLRATSTELLASGPAHDQYVQALRESSHNSSVAMSQVHGISGEYYWTATTILALAMDAAHSDSPQVYDKYITQIANPSPGATVVTTYNQGKKLLAMGKRIQYIGLTGPLDFNKYHASTPPLAEYRFDGSGNNVTIQGMNISAARVGELVAGL